MSRTTAPYDPKDLICEDMGCPFIFVQPDCVPGHCPRIDEARKHAGAVYMVVGDGEAFVGLLPGRRKH